MEEIILKNCRQAVSCRAGILLIAFLFCSAVLSFSGTCAAGEKMLESVKIGSFKEKSRVVLQLSSAGFYEINNQPENAMLTVRLFDFSRGQVPPRQLVDERLIKGIEISQKDQFLQIQLALTTSQYHYRAHLFKSPPLLVIDLQGSPPAVEEKAVTAENQQKHDEKTEKSESEPDAGGNVEEKSPDAVEPAAEPKAEKAEAVVIKPVKPEIMKPLSKQSPEDKPLSPEKSVSPKSGSSSPEENELPVNEQDEENLEAVTLPEEPVSAPAAESEIDAGRELYEQGLRQYLRGEWEKAMESFTRLVTLFPHSSLVPKALFRYNDALAQQAKRGNKQNLHHLIDNYLQVARKYPRDSDAPWALLQVGRFYESMGFHYEAEGVYQALAHQYPQSRFAAAAWYETARINYALKRYRKALHAYEQLVKKYPERGFSVEAEFYQGHCLYHLGDFTAALSSYQAALKKAPEYLQTDPQTIYLVGSCYLSLKQYQRARDYLLLMRNLFPENKLTNLALAKVGDSLLTQGKFVEGIAFLATVINEYPQSDGEILARLSMARLGVENPGLARRPGLKAYAEFLDPVRVYSLIADKYPDNSLSNVARLRLGRLLHEQHDYAGARQLFDQLLQPGVDHEIRAEALGEMRKVIYDELGADYKQKKYAAMVALQERYSSNFLPRPTGIYPFFWLAEAMRHQGLYAGALKLYGALQGFKPSREEFLAITWGMARCHLSLGQVQDAAGLLQPLSMDELENTWWMKMMLLRAEIMVRKGENSAALKILPEIRSRLPAGDIFDRVSLLAMTAEAFNHGGESDAAVAAYREALSLADAQPQTIDLAQRVAMTSALARILFVKGDYQASLARFRQAALLTNHHDTIAELLYWQSLCHARLGRTKELEKTIKTLRTHYGDSDWTSLAISNFKDYQWKKEHRDLE